MRTHTLLLPSLLALGAFVAVPNLAQASPKPTKGYYTAPHAPEYRPGDRAKSNNVPELSVGASAAALGLLGGGVMVLTGRRRRQKSG